MNIERQIVTITHLDITPIDPEWPNFSILEFKQWLDDLIDDIPISPQSVRFEISATMGDEVYYPVPNIIIEYVRLETDEEYERRLKLEAEDQMAITQQELRRLVELREKYKDWDGGFPLQKADLLIKKEQS
jgi:hypothetical protein